MSVYNEVYSKNEIYFATILQHTGEEIEYNTFNTGEYDIEIEVDGYSFRKTDGTGTEISLELEFIELSVDVTGGVAETRVFETNKNRRKPDLIGLDSRKDDVSSPLVVDETGAKILLRVGGVASKGEIQYNRNVGTRYYLKRNTWYTLKSSITLGAYNTSESSVFGVIREI